MKDWTDENVENVNQMVWKVHRLNVWVIAKNVENFSWRFKYKSTSSQTALPPYSLDLVPFS